MVAVKENEHPVAVSPRHDEDLVQVAMRLMAGEREVDEPCAPRRVVLPAVATARDRHDDDG